MCQQERGCCNKTQIQVCAAELKLGHCFDHGGWTIIGRRGRLVLSGTFVTSGGSIAWKIIFLEIVCDHCVKNNIAIHIA